MSVAFVSVLGSPRTASLSPTDTSDHTLIDVGSLGSALLQVIIANNTGSAATATVQWHDGTTDWDIYAGKSISANDTLIAELFIRLPENGAIKVASGTANALTFTVTIADYVGQVGGRV